MRILEHHLDPISGHTYAVIVNPIADGLGGLPAHRYRLICARIPDWIQRVNTTRSVSSPGSRSTKPLTCWKPGKGWTVLIEGLPNSNAKPESLAAPTTLLLIGEPHDYLPVLLQPPA